MVQYNMGVHILATEHNCINKNDKANFDINPCLSTKMLRVLKNVQQQNSLNPLQNPFRHPIERIFYSPHNASEREVER